MGWAISRTNDFAAWFDTEKFYQPIYSADFDVMNTKTITRAKLKQSYDVRHGFSLIIHAKHLGFQAFKDLDGSITYTFRSNGQILKSYTTAPPIYPLVYKFRKDAYRIPLFDFDLPFEGATGDLFLEVTLNSPITKLKEYRDSISCEISPFYSVK